MRPVAAQESTFKVDVRLVRLLVTVKDAAGRLIGSLNKDDFSVFDNGAPQRIAVFERHTELFHLSQDGLFAGRPTMRRMRNVPAST